VIVHDLDILSAGCGPAEADAKLIVDPDAVSTGAIALQGLKAVARRDTKVNQDNATRD
jgi:hypothetical protein